MRYVLQDGTCLSFASPRVNHLVILQQRIPEVIANTYYMFNWNKCVVQLSMEFLLK